MVEMLQQSLDDQLARFATVVRACEQLIDTRPDELAAIDADLRVLDELSSPVRGGTLR